MKIEQVYPIVFRWIMEFGNIMLDLARALLDCTCRGMDSVLNMRASSFSAVIWCSILSLIAVIGMLRILYFLVITALVGLLFGCVIAILLSAISGISSLEVMLKAGLVGLLFVFALVILSSATAGIVLFCLYGSFWTTALVMFFGGLAFTFGHERLAVLLATMYFLYFAWTYIGWVGLLLGLNLSTISSDALSKLIISWEEDINELGCTNTASEQTAGTQGRPGIFSDDQVHASSSEIGSGPSADEVVRLLNCADHYSALGLSKFENVDVSTLERQYKKKAMLVYPDKNRDNKKAADAVKKLKNAHEVLLDPFKQKAYDDELSRGSE